jgi:Domain of unknown function (DUF1918)
MRASVGDWLIPEGDPGRSGLVIGLQHADGSPPYVIRWQSGGHIALVFPGPYDRIVSDASHTSRPAAVGPA